MGSAEEPGVTVPGSLFRRHASNWEMEIVPSVGKLVCVAYLPRNAHVEMHMKSSMGMLRREDCVPAGCARRCLLAWAAVCKDALCFVDSHRPAVMNA